MKLGVIASKFGINDPENEVELLHRMGRIVSMEWDAGAKHWRVRLAYAAIAEKYGEEEALAAQAVREMVSILRGPASVPTQPSLSRAPPDGFSALRGFRTGMFMS